MAAKDFNHEYQGFKLKVYNREYSIYKMINGRYKMVRYKNVYGKPLKYYESDEVALQKAKDWIDENTNKIFKGEPGWVAPQQTLCK